MQLSSNTETNFACVVISSSIIPLKQINTNASMKRNFYYENHVSSEYIFLYVADIQSTPNVLEQQCFIVFTRYQNHLGLRLNNEYEATDQNFSFDFLLLSFTYINNQALLLADHPILGYQNYWNK